jgi:Carboxypeptidase regulatory-like domain
VQRSQVKIVLLALVLTSASMCRAADPAAVISGVVRDAQGVAQMGALVQVVAGDSAMVGTAFTDLHGRYLIAHLLPGKYEVRATAALFVPALRANLQLHPGSRAIVNLTLNTIFEPTAWLPAERRKADEPSDDWKWTLRSAANRPILRMADDNGDMVMVSSSATETPSKSPDRATASVTTGDGGFGGNGIHNVLVLDRALDDGANMSFRSDFGSSIGSVPSRPSADIAMGYERQLGFAGAGRTVVSYQSHPEMIGSGYATGLDAMQFANAQRMQFGDLADVEVGSMFYVVRTAGSAAVSRPFLRLTTHPTDAWNAGYRMATSRDLQSYTDLDAVQQELPVAVVSQQGRVHTEQGTHQEFFVGRKAGRGIIQLSYYFDSLNSVMLSGGGALSPSDIEQVNQTGSGAILADETTGNFRLLGTGYKSRGVNVTFTEPITPGMWVAVEYSTGSALTAKDGVIVTLPTIATDLTEQSGQAATLALKGRVIRSGTRVRAAYRWQPTRLVTAIDPYRAFSDQAYLSCYLRQTIKLGSLLPPGLEATVDVTNLLAQGYRPFLSADGKTLFLAQTPRTVQAGLAFTF